MGRTEREARVCWVGQTRMTSRIEYRRRRRAPSQAHECRENSWLDLELRARLYVMCTAYEGCMGL